MQVHPDLILRVSRQQMSVRTMILYTFLHMDFDFRKVDKYIKENIWVWSSEQDSMLDKVKILVRKRKVWIQLNDKEMLLIRKHNETCKKLIVFLKKLLKEGIDEKQFLIK